MKTIENSLFIRGNAPDIFDFVTTAKHWVRWHPATLGVTGQIEQPMRPGDVIRERAKIGESVGENDWTVTEWEPMRRVVLSMPQTRLGDLKIEYTFVEQDGGVEFRRALTFDASSFPQQVADKIEAQMQSDSRIATERIKEMFEGIGAS